MEFQTAYNEFIKLHVQNEKVSAVQRIEFGLEHAEKIFLENIWWSAFRNFKHLYPQYEIRDFKEGRRYIDFAYIHSHFRIAIEVDGMGPTGKTSPKRNSVITVKDKTTLLSMVGISFASLIRTFGTPPDCANKPSSNLSDG